MTAKEKAHELIVKALVDFERLTISESKKIALIAANEVLGYMGADRGTEFWEQVKSEIENL